MVHSLALSREIYVPRELVFDVLTRAEHLEIWYAEIPGRTCDASVDLRTGGSFRLTWSEPDGAQAQESGTYEHVRVPEEYAGTRRLDLSGAAPLQTAFVVRLAATEGGSATRIEISEQGFPDAQQRDSAQARWQARLDRLESYFSAI
ncbi:MAG: SRPBCC domain-containing protein [Pseudomonadales bacterium]